MNGTQLENIEIELIQHENLIVIKADKILIKFNTDKRSKTLGKYILLCGTEIPG